MDIENLYTAPCHEQGAELQIKSPVDGEMTDCYIKVMGVDAKPFRDSMKRQQRELLRQLDKEDFEVDDLSLLVDATIGWRGFTNKGKEWKFSKENARALYENSPSIARQVEVFINNRKNFTKG